MTKKLEIRIAGSSEPTTADRTPSPLERWRWQPGQSGNPSGRSKGRKDLELLARLETAEGADAIRLWGQMMRGELPGTTGAKGLKWRDLGARRLIERGYGKIRSEVSIEVSRPNDGADLLRRALESGAINDDDLIRLMDFRERLEHTPSIETTATEVGNGTEAGEQEEASTAPSESENSTK